MSESRFQFSAKNLLVATTIMAIWSALFVAGFRHVPDGRGTFVVTVIGSLIMGALPAAAVGALFGRGLLGACCGLTSVVGLLLWRLYGF